jgi:superoxide dismutase, Fe-Mn family
VKGPAVFTLPNLPYAYDALQPTMSDRTLHHHHDKHHAKYVDTLNTLLKDKAELADQSLEAVIASAREAGDKKLFNNAAQAWNHGFFWECLSPKGGEPTGALAEAIKAAFGDLDGFKKSMTTEGVGHFASGWAWLVAEGDALKVISTHDAETVADRDDVRPILVIDVWEHAYYLDFQQDREGFLKGVLDKIVNWDFAAKQFEASKAAGQGGYRYPAPERKAA